MATQTQSQQVQTEEGPRQYDILPQAASWQDINTYYVSTINGKQSTAVGQLTVHDVYGTADLKKIRMALDEE